MKNRENRSLFKGFLLCLVGVFVFTLFSIDIFRVTSLSAAPYGLPNPSFVLQLTKPCDVPLLKGIRFNPLNPQNIEFIVDNANKNNIQPEIERLVSYFLAGLTLPSDDLWVNLSPYEKDRVIEKNVVQTDLGKDMLSQDYILKQLASSLTHPDNKLGKQYWKDMFGGSRKLWLEPGKSVVSQGNNIAMITESTIDVRAEDGNAAYSILLPEIKKEVNNGKHFSRLRQIYHSLILSIWFKKRFKDTLYSSYIDQNKITGIDLSDKNIKNNIFNLYLKSVNRGVYNFVERKEKKRYFCGGVLTPTEENIEVIRFTSSSVAELGINIKDEYATVTIQNEFGSGRKGDHSTSSSIVDKVTSILKDNDFVFFKNKVDGVSVVSATAREDGFDAKARECDYIFDVTMMEIPKDRLDISSEQQDNYPGVTRRGKKSFININVKQPSRDNKFAATIILYPVKEGYSLHYSVARNKELPKASYSESELFLKILDKLKSLPRVEIVPLDRFSQKYPLNAINLSAPYFFRKQLAKGRNFIEAFAETFKVMNKIKGFEQASATDLRTVLKERIHYSVPLEIGPIMQYLHFKTQLSKEYDIGHMYKKVYKSSASSKAALSKLIKALQSADPRYELNPDLLLPVLRVYGFTVVDLKEYNSTRGTASENQQHRYDVAGNPDDLSKDELAITADYESLLDQGYKCRDAFYLLINQYRKAKKHQDKELSFFSKSIFRAGHKSAVLLDYEKLIAKLSSIKKTGEVCYYVALDLCEHKFSPVDINLPGTAGYYMMKKLMVLDGVEHRVYVGIRKTIKKSDDAFIKVYIQRSKNSKRSGISAVEIKAISEKDFKKKYAKKGFITYFKGELKTDKSKYVKKQEQAITNQLKEKLKQTKEVKKEKIKERQELKKIKDKEMAVRDAARKLQQKLDEAKRAEEKTKKELVKQEQKRIAEVAREVKKIARQKKKEADEAIVFARKLAAKEEKEERKGQLKENNKKRTQQSERRKNKFPKRKHKSRKSASLKKGKKESDKSTATKDERLRKIAQGVRRNKLKQAQQKLAQKTLSSFEEEDNRTLILAFDEDPQNKRDLDNLARKNASSSVDGGIDFKENSFDLEIEEGATQGKNFAKKKYPVIESLSFKIILKGTISGKQVIEGLAAI